MTYLAVVAVSLTAALGASQDASQNQSVARIRLEVTIAEGEGNPKRTSVVAVRDTEMATVQQGRTRFGFRPTLQSSQDSVRLAIFDLTPQKPKLLEKLELPADGSTTVTAKRAPFSIRIQAILRP
jgi:hypothetical protein